MKITIDNFESFIDGSWDYDKEKERHTGLWIKPDKMDVTGGRITKEEIDRIEDCSQREVLTISGLTQETFEYFIEKYGKEIKAIRFFKNKLVEDWSLLGTLPELEFVYWFHNQRITTLWDMTHNVNLKGLCISDFTRLHDLDGINCAKKLQAFYMQDAVWYKTVVNSYTCFSNSNLTYLNFGGKKILDEDLSFVEQMKNLKRFDFAPNLFSTEKIAWLMANYPEVEGDSLEMFIEDWHYNKETDDYDIPALVLPGKGKRSFPSSNQIKKQKYEKEIMDLLSKYKGLSYREAFE